MSERLEDVIRKNGQYITDWKKRPGCCMLFTINLRYEIRQDLVIKLTFILVDWNWIENIYKKKIKKDKQKWTGLCGTVGLPGEKRESKRPVFAVIHSAGKRVERNVSKSWSTMKG